MQSEFIHSGSSSRRGTLRVNRLVSVSFRVQVHDTRGGPQVSAAEQTTHTNTERATAQRRLIVEVVVAAPKLPLSAALSFVYRYTPREEGRRVQRQRTAQGEELLYMYIYMCIYTYIYTHTYVYIHI